MSLHTLLDAYLREAGHLVVTNADFHIARLDKTIAYTIGLTQTYGHPDLLVFGYKPAIAQMVLDDISLAVRSGKVFDDGDVVYEIDSYPLTFRTIPEAAARMFAPYPFGLNRPTARPARYMQLVRSDNESRFPWIDGYSGASGGQQELWAAPAERDFEARTRPGP